MIACKNSKKICEKQSFLWRKRGGGGGVEGDKMGKVRQAPNTDHFIELGKMSKLMEKYCTRGARQAKN